MYRDIQEPMLSATAEQFSRNPFAGLVDNTSVNNPQQGRENTEPLPNPWSGQPQRTNTNTSTTTSTTTTSGTTTSTTAPGVSPQLNDMLQQMTENPLFIQNIMSSPHMQQIMQSMAADPNMANALIADNPLLAGNPAMQEQMRTMLPQVLQNPDMANLITNPQALSAMMQIQQGFQNLRQTFLNLDGSQPTTGTSATSTTTPTTTVGAPSTTAQVTGTNTTTTTSAPAAQATDSFSELLARMVASTENTVPPEQHYQQQLEQLAAMGFVNEKPTYRH
ncbi:hypothetical protein NQ318_020667 [Aromia moschata]|uniref:STI1 domain-containing protein n=1 Tax=Aromia moschata TaxID=1265417 RepID=A0AAV8XX22_9CUCU|nr:hypothetical protein NQ318_020667 [Aromia moschata]